MLRAANSARDYSTLLAEIASLVNSHAPMRRYARVDDTSMHLQSISRSPHLAKASGEASGIAQKSSSKIQNPPERVSFSACPYFCVRYLLASSNSERSVSDLLQSASRLL